jgi:hypothetical protein
MALKTVEIERALGVGWLKNSLTQGFDLSKAALEVVKAGEGTCKSFISDEIDSYRTNLAEGGMARTGESMAALAQELNGLALRHARCVIVEDDLWRRTDETLEKFNAQSPISFVDNRVIHWCDVKQENGADCVDVVNKGASGYPLNAFVISKFAGELGLVDREDVPEGLPSEVAESLLAVIVAAFDAETFMVWSRLRDGASRIIDGAM